MSLWLRAGAMRRASVVVSWVLTVGVASAGFSARAATPAGPGNSGQPAAYAFQTFDAPGHVDTGLHGANHRGDVAGYVDDVSPRPGEIAYPTGFVLRRGTVHPVVWAAGIYTDLNDVNDD